MQKILIVDDRESNLFALESTLKRLDVEIIRALTGEDALRATLNHDFALAILDVQMPGMDGYELAAFLRSDVRTRSIPLIFMSAVYSDEAYVFKGYESGGVDFITKPFNSEILLSKVRIFLEIDEQRAELERQKARLERLVSDLEAQVEARKRMEKEVERKSALLDGINQVLRKSHDELEIRVRERTAELARTNEALRESEKRLIFSQEAAEVGAWELDLASLEIWRSERHDRIFGYDTPVVKWTYEMFLDHILPEDRAEVDKKLQKALENNDDWDIECRIRRKDGVVRWIWARSRSRLNQDGRPVSMVGLIKDITRQKSMEETLRLDEARFEALYELAQMSERTDQDIIDFVREEQARITRSKIGIIDFLDDDDLGYTVRGWSRSVMEECSMVDKPAHFPLEGAGLWAQAIRERRPIIVNDYSSPHSGKKGYPEGHVELHRMLSIPVFDGNRIVAVAVVANKEEPYTHSDVQHLSLLMDGMLRLLKRKQTEEAQRIYTIKLEQSNRELEDFAFVASHDLQEPLRKIRTFADRLKTAYGHLLDDRGLDYLERMERASQRMQSLIHDLLKYSRVTSSREPFKAANLKDSVQGAILDLRLLIEETGGRIIVGDLPCIEADPVQMRQLFQNLIGNALKYHGEGRPEIEICWNSSNPDGLLEIQVKDNGIGFDESYLDKIFKPFQRLHGWHSPYPGTGMGLAISRRIVERHGGDITARSEPGKGAVFIIRLPGRQPKLESIGSSAG
jgi:PAS domain S-box-containing protein